jgi:hypothetical protein
MPTQRDVRKIAGDLPGVIESADTFAFSIEVKGKAKGFIWSWKERVHPKKPRVERDDVVAVRVESLAAKEALLSSDPVALFTEPHYEGFPAVLVRLDAIGLPALRELIADAHRSIAGAPKPKPAPKRKQATSKATPNANTTTATKPRASKRKPKRAVS